jgi:histidine phosphotransferase ChpT
VQQDSVSLAALIGSRICHDLISPIGAISNGLELAGMTASAPMSPEMSLIQQSCDHATARIRFFRIAFGTATDVRPIPVADARKTLADHYAGTRISAEWHVVRDLGRDATQLAYLCALCLEATLPQGGLLRVDLRDGMLVVTACASVLRDDPLLWCLLTDKGGAAVQNISPATVQFALLGRICRDRDVTPRRALSEHETTLRLPLPLPPS